MWKSIRSNFFLVSCTIGYQGGAIYVTQDHPYHTDTRNRVVNLVERRLEMRVACGYPHDGKASTPSASVVIRGHADWQVNFDMLVDTQVP